MSYGEDLVTILKDGPQPLAIIYQRFKAQHPEIGSVNSLVRSYLQRHCATSRSRSQYPNLPVYFINPRRGVWGIDPAVSEDRVWVEGHWRDAPADISAEASAATLREFRLMTEYAAQVTDPNVRIRVSLVRRTH